MIVAAVDDLMLRSRISTAAKHSGVEIRFVSQSEQVIAAAEAGAALIIFDLNSARIDAVATVRVLKSRSGLSDIPTLGFVSHVDTAAIDAARGAGVDEVLARGAFVSQLGSILSRFGSATPLESRPS